MPSPSSSPSNKPSYKQRRQRAEEIRAFLQGIPDILDKISHYEKFIASLRKFVDYLSSLTEAARLKWFHLAYARFAQAEATQPKSLENPVLLAPSSPVATKAVGNQGTAAIKASKGKKAKKAKKAAQPV